MRACGDITHLGSAARRVEAKTGASDRIHEHCQQNTALRRSRRPMGMRDQVVPIIHKG
jgi:hypothetical protein